MELNNKKITRAWAMYDWANSVFSLTITTAIFPPYFEAMSKKTAIAQQGVTAEPYYLNFLGTKIVTTALYSYALSFSFLLVALITPVLSGIADVKQNKKFFMKLFCYTGSVSCMLMFFFTDEFVYGGLFLFMLALFGFAGSIVYYNAFLPEIATENNFDKLSARGFSLGYIGSVILLLINLATIMLPDWFFPVTQMAATLTENGQSNAEAMLNAKSYFENLAIRLSFVSVGVWWMGFAQITFKHLPENTKTVNYNGNIFNKGFNELKKVWNEINLPDNSLIKKYLAGFFFTSMGLQTVMYVASLFGSQELKLPAADLIILIIIIQLVAVLGAWLFSKVSSMHGNILTIIILIFVWMVICFIAYMVQNKLQFYGLGLLVGLVMGGSQSLLRSTYAKIIPDKSKSHASYFSFYDAAEKFAIVFGTFTFGFLINYTGNMRTSVIAIAVFFMIGMFFIARIKNFKEKHP